MLQLLEAQENQDQPVPDINVPVLTPQPPSRVQRFKEYAADKRQIFKKYADVDVDVVDLRAQADASMPASNNNVKLYNISNF